MSETGLGVALLEAPVAPEAAGAACAAAAVLAAGAEELPAGFLTRTRLTAVLGAVAPSVLAAAAPVDLVGLTAAGPDGEVGPGEGAVELPGDRLLVLLRLPEVLDGVGVALGAGAPALLACESRTTGAERTDEQNSLYGEMQYQLTWSGLLPPVLKQQAVAKLPSHVARELRVSTTSPTLAVTQCNRRTC